MGWRLAKVMPRKARKASSFLLTFCVGSCCESEGTKIDSWEKIELMKRRSQLVMAVKNSQAITT